MTAVLACVPICAICEKPAYNAVAREGLDAICKSCLKPVGLPEPMLTTDKEQARVARIMLACAKQDRAIARQRHNHHAWVMAEYAMQQAEMRLAACEVKAARCRQEPEKPKRITPDSPAYRDFILGKRGPSNGHHVECHDYTAYDADRAGVLGW